MSRIVRLHAAVEEEVNAALEYYEAIDIRLATGLSERLVELIDFVTDYPQVGRTCFEDYRQRVARGYPYQVIYYIEGEIVTILALTHTHRGPEQVERQIKERR